MLKLKPQDGLQIFFTGAYNYVPADPKSTVHAHDYYLYVKVFNECCKEDSSLVSLFPVAIEQFLEKSDIVNAYEVVGLVQKLYAVYKDKYRSDIFDEANRQIDADLKENPILKKKRPISEHLKLPRQETSQPKKRKKRIRKMINSTTVVLIKVAVVLSF